MKTELNENQIVIETNTDNEKRMLPLNMLVTLAAGALAGMVIIFSFFWAIEKIFGM